MPNALALKAPITTLVVYFVNTVDPDQTALSRAA